MIKAVFKSRNDVFTGFDVSGHANFADSGSDIVCASVTSAVQLVCNGITEIIKYNADVAVLENTISLNLPENAPKEALDFVSALHLHLTILAQEYKKNLTITVLEV